MPEIAAMAPVKKAGAVVNPPNGPKSPPKVSGPGQVGERVLFWRDTPRGPEASPADLIRAVPGRPGHWDLNYYRLGVLAKAIAVPFADAAGGRCWTKLGVT